MVIQGYKDELYLMPSQKRNGPLRINLETKLEVAIKFERRLDSKEEEEDENEENPDVDTSYEWANLNRKK
uniref:Uncharacterized protein n=1 Tax=Cucumis melo TaxID=3656 RepID=A0A9I9E6F0_CUCME